MMEPKNPERGVQLQDRDWELLIGLFESRTMLRKHLLDLYFSDVRDYGEKRIPRLTKGGYIGEREYTQIRGQYSPAIRYLTSKGLRALEEKSQLISAHGLSWEVLEKRLGGAQSSITHELEIVDIKVALTTALRGHPSLTLETFATWPRLFQFEAEHFETKQLQPLKPDAYIEIHETVGAGDEVDEYRYFLEHDRSHEVRRLLEGKAYGYNHFYRDGGMALRCGLSASDYKAVPFRVLITLLSESRRNNVAEHLATQQPLGKNQFYLTTLAEIRDNPLGNIWMTVKDYIDVTAGTMYDAQTFVTKKTESARDRMVAERVTKRKLIDA